MRKEAPMALVAARYLCNQVIAEDNPKFVKEGFEGAIQRLIDAMASPDLNVDVFTKDARRWLKKHMASDHFQRAV